jgi:hypothetical protein
MTKRTTVIISLLALVFAGAILVVSRTRAAGDLSPKEARKLIAMRRRLRAPAPSWSQSPRPSNHFVASAARTLNQRAKPS